MEKETKDLTKYDFIRELKIMAASCIGLKPDTAKKKAAAIFKKYADIIEYSAEEKKYIKNESIKMTKKLDALKKGFINYSINGKYNGILLLKDIEQVEEKLGGILLITKTGREITMGRDFNYLIELF